MPIAAILLLLVSALLHTIWNLLLKQAREKYIATWWAVLLGSAIFLPGLFFTGLPARETWLLLFLSVLAETAYYIVLSTAYLVADFSLVYPLARGAAPLMIAIWSVIFLHEQLSIGGLAGLGIIIAGLIVIGFSTFWARSQNTPVASSHWQGLGLALFLAFLISIYSTIDGAAVKQTSAFSYAIPVFFLSPIFSTPLVLKRYGWQTLKAEFFQHKLPIISIGLLSVGAYLLALVAYSMARVSYSGAIREVSVVLGALAGWLFLGERMGSLRVIGSLAVFSGILVIAWLG